MISKAIIEPIRAEYSIESLREAIANCKKYSNYRVLAVFPNYKEVAMSFVVFPTEELLGVSVRINHQRQEINMSCKNGSWIKFLVHGDYVTHGFRVNTLLESPLVSKSTLDNIYAPMLIPYRV